MDDFLREKISDYDKLPPSIKENLRQCMDQIRYSRYKTMSNNDEAYSAVISEGACKACLNYVNIKNKIKKEIDQLIRECIADNRG
ncbi:hypothetical protein H6G94_11850 [Nostoc punctiforme FACHB-252]|uniref:Uncharacterized protein n=1 Tax=Nostoc punctiforme FACHB-252 TaxID=1357509 RepID=A0ABR8H9L9_NOSPU|nr:hypothetical protein [Nostoc punctiforme]MBD2611961.1 hypothetical protein [Nostoc punctiforme FACHB-252]